ncbi:cbb3-type cytochrome oxidase assembly protein CcoS [Arsukibacterium sp.]|uniref:cbb3-type cytochrome oxidase assembly protein CcoS n=1 Tax=Arsukibacterium sp. TaxID=1977258 RepID=UPI0026396198|nr:cbb3-type cytochrome oxidase assembly protein CcoS [Arsukibacterium sp.]
MSIIYVLIPIAILFVMLGLAIFFWAVRSKQFEDLDKEGFSILFDEQQVQSKAAAQPEKRSPTSAENVDKPRQQDEAGQ